MFGEWYQGNTSDPLYHDSYKFANKSGMSMLDFPLNTAIRSVFGSNANFSDIDSVLTQEAGNFTWKEDLVTFIDNHDMARFLSVNNNNNRLHEAMAFVLTARGIPCIYYGTEQYLHNDTSGGTDPYNRPMMSGFSTGTTAYTLINRLSTLPAQQSGNSLRLNDATLDEQRRVHLRTQSSSATSCWWPSTRTKPPVTASAD